MSWSDAFLLSSLATSEADFGMLRVSASAEFDLPSPTRGLWLPVPTPLNRSQWSETTSRRVLQGSWR